MQMKNLRLKGVKTRPRSRSQVNDGTGFKAQLPEAQSCAARLVRPSLGAAEKARLAAAPQRDPREGGRSHHHVVEVNGPASSRPHHGGRRLHGDAEETASLCFSLPLNRRPRPPESPCGEVQTSQTPPTTMRSAVLGPH